MSYGFGNLQKVILNILEHSGVVNEKALTAALDYVATQTNPIKSEISNQTINIAIVTIWMIGFSIIFILIVLVFWICYEVNAKKWLMFLVIFCIILTVLIGGYISVLSTAKTIDTIVQNSVNELITLDNPQTRNVIIITLNSASSEYLGAIGNPCALD